MGLRKAFVLCLVLLLGAAPTFADLVDQQPSYTRMAAQCGKGLSGPSFSKAEYAAALKDAAKASKQAAKDGNSARGKAIKQQVEALKDCEKQEVPRYPMPPMRNCTQFKNALSAFASWAVKQSAAKKITDEQMDQMTQEFRPAGLNCMREIMTKCVRPNDTKTVMYVVDAIEAAELVGAVNSYAKQTGIERSLTETNPGFLRPSFCSDTDYACKGDPEFCSYRVAQIKRAMQTYITR